MIRDNLLYRAARTAVALPVAAVVGALGLGVMKSIEAGIESANLEMKLVEAKRNHAEIEGAWVPFDMGVLKREWEMDAWEYKLDNHATIEGAYFQPEVSA